MGQTQKFLCDKNVMAPVIEDAVKPLFLVGLKGNAALLYI